MNFLSELKRKRSKGGMETEAKANRGRQKRDFVEVDLITRNMRRDRHNNKRLFVLACWNVRPWGGIDTEATRLTPLYAVIGRFSDWVWCDDCGKCACMFVPVAFVSRTIDKCSMNCDGFNQPPAPWTNNKNSFLFFGCFARVVRCGPTKTLD